MFSIHEVNRTTGEVVFDGTMRGYTKICDLMGWEAISNLWRWRASFHKGMIVEDKSVVVVPTSEADTAVMQGDTVKVDEDGNVFVIRRGDDK